jgi:ABC-2 type transport system permease protein
MSAYRTVPNINWVGLGYFYRKEVLKFANIWIQTMVAPAISSVLFFSIFLIAVSQRKGYVGGLEFSTFLIPGLVMMSVLQNSFINVSSSIVIGKIQRNIVDTLMPPLSNAELCAGFLGAAMTRGMIVAVVVTLALSFIGKVAFFNIGIALCFLLLGSLMMGSIGMMVGIWAEKFDHQATISNFIIAPMTFLSGTFYSIKALPETLQTISKCNPFFYVINGMRYGFTGYSDGSVFGGLLYIIILDMILVFCAYSMLRSGYKLRP